MTDGLPRSELALPEISDNLKNRPAMHNRPLRLQRTDEIVPDPCSDIRGCFMLTYDEDFFRADS